MPLAHPRPSHFDDVRDDPMQSRCAGELGGKTRRSHAAIRLSFKWQAQCKALRSLQCGNLLGWKFVKPLC